MEFDVWAKTDVGLKREINQDTILVDPELHLFIVADGMGGHKGGEVASALAVENRSGSHS
jgi:serine/threonine protein phosphatase PrpC